MFVVVFYLPYALGAPALATVAVRAGGVTDWLDGYLARRLDQTSPFGAFLDPVADKLMVAMALVLLVQPAMHARGDRRCRRRVVIIGREIAVSALREWMAETRQARQVAVSLIGKFKTICRWSAMPLLLYREPLFGLPIVSASAMVLLCLAAALTLWSMVVYLRPPGRPDAPANGANRTRRGRLDRYGPARLECRRLRRGNSSVGRAQPCQG